MGNLSTEFWMQVIIQAALLGMGFGVMKTRLDYIERGMGEMKTKLDKHNSFQDRLTRLEVGGGDPTHLNQHGGGGNI